MQRAESPAVLTVIVLKREAQYSNSVSSSVKREKNTATETVGG